MVWDVWDPQEGGNENSIALVTDIGSVTIQTGVEESQAVAGECRAWVWTHLATPGSAGSHRKSLSNTGAASDFRFVRGDVAALLSESHLRLFVNELLVSHP